MELGGSSALVVGGTSGLGAAAARRLRAKGCAVVAAVEGALDQAPLRVVVHCAGSGFARRVIGRDGAYQSAHPLEEFAETVSNNLVGTFNVIGLAGTAMSRTDPDGQGQRGTMVITSSLAARTGQVGQAAYVASKAGQLGMVLPLARDLASVGVRVNVIAPGGIDTPICGPGARTRSSARGSPMRRSTIVGWPPRTSSPRSRSSSSATTT